MSDSPELVDFAVRLVNSVHNLPDGQVNSFGEIQITEEFRGAVEMTFGLVHASYSLPEWQAVKLTFFKPCKSV